MVKKILFVLTLLISSNSFAEERTEYPELQVTPRASERLKIESSYEQVKPWLIQAPISASALATFVASMSQSGKIDLKKDPQEQSKSAGMVVGGGWLIANMFMAYQYQGYTTAYNRIMAMPAATPRDQLIKERLAEEEINHLGRIGKTMKWGSFVTNFIASGYMLSKAQKDSSAQIYDGIAMAASFLPLIFSNHFEDVSIEQQQYKKKIFGTITSNFLFQDPISSKWNPGVGFVATF